jgi:hypothetical protein
LIADYILEMNGSLVMLQMIGNYILEMDGSLVMLQMIGDYMLAYEETFTFLFSFHTDLEFDVL